MRRTSLLATLVVIVGAALAAGCVARPEVTPGAPPPTPAVRAGSTEQEGEDDTASGLASRFPLPASAADEEEVEYDDSQCIDCHTDQQAVQALAEEPEEEEELSEGEG